MGAVVNLTGALLSPDRDFQCPFRGERIPAAAKAGICRPSVPRGMDEAQLGKTLLLEGLRTAAAPRTYRPAGTFGIIIYLVWGDGFILEELHSLFCHTEKILLNAGLGGWFRWRSLSAGVSGHAERNHSRCCAGRDCIAIKLEILAELLTEFGK